MTNVVLCQMLCCLILPQHQQCLAVFDNQFHSTPILFAHVDLDHYPVNCLVECFEGRCHQGDHYRCQHQVPLLVQVQYLRINYQNEINVLQFHPVLLRFH